MVAGYDQFVANVPFYGFAVLCIDHPAVQQMIPRLSDHRIVTYGFSPQADVRADRMTADKLGCTFEVTVTDRARGRSRKTMPFRLPMLGQHNVQNALAAIAVGLEMDIDDETLRSAFLGFRGVKRRFTKTGESFMNRSSSVFNESGSNASKIDLDLQKKFQGQEGGMDSPQQIMKDLKLDIQKQLGRASDQVKVDIYEGGVRIQVIDRRGRPMFDSGSSNPTPYGKKVLGVIGEYIKSLPNRVAIEGHTDALPFVKGSETNWDLSTDRALATQKILKSCGLDPSRVSRVAGYADTVPYVKNDPLDPRNRRISIILLFGGTYHRSG
jgi:flagellar motor protein MotB